MNEIGDINWDLPIKSLKNNQQNLKLDSKIDKKLMQQGQDWRDVLIFLSTSQQSCC